MGMTSELGKWRVDRFAEDVEILGSAGKKILIARPLRRTPSGSLGAVVENGVVALGLSANGRLAADLSAPKYRQILCSLVSPGQVFQLPFLEPKREGSEEEFSWAITDDDFGIYVNVLCNDEITEELVTYFLVTCRFNVLSWSSSPECEHGWVIKLSSNLSIEVVASRVTSFFERDAYRILAKSGKEERQKLYKLQHDIDSIDSASKKEIAELLRYIEDIEARLADAEINKAQAVETRVENTVRKLKKSDFERILENIIIAMYKNIALAPQSSRTILERFPDSRGLWEVLSDLNEGKPVHCNALHGTAGRCGWKELRKHVPTGKDNRGRIYLRQSSKTHSLDVVVHWKSDNDEQNRFIEGLSRLPAFDGPEVVRR